MGGKIGKALCMHGRNACWVTGSKYEKVACGAFSALQPVDRLYPCPSEFPSFISRGATHHIGTRDLC